MRRRAAVGACMLVACVALLWRCNTTGALPTEPAPAGSAASAHHARASRHAAPIATDLGSIAGTITDDAHAPIARARVCADPERDDLRGDDPRCTDADDHGAYLLADLPAAAYILTASADRRIPAWVPSLDLPARAHLTGIDLVLRDGGVAVTGTVTDAGGGAISHARVRASGVTGRFSGGPPVLTDDVGAFQLWAEPGAVDVSAVADGYTTDRAWGTAPGSFELVLTPASSIDGVVIDAQTRRPVAGAAIIVASQEHRYTELDAVSDDDGRFHVDALTAGRYVAWATAPHAYGHSDGSMRVGIAQHADGLVLELHPALRVEGRAMIAGAPPTPCPHPRLGLVHGDPTENPRFDGTADGVIHADGVRPDRYTAYISCDHRQLVTLLVVEDRDVTGLEWTLPAGGTIRGHVRTPDGAPVAGVAIDVDVLHLVTASDGSFASPPMTAASYGIAVVSRSGIDPLERDSVTVTDGVVTTKDLIKYPGGTVTGRVLDTDGKPAAHVTILLDIGTAQTGDDGRYRFDDVRPGTFALHAHYADTVSPRQDVVVTAGHTTVADLTIDARGGRITGIVVDPTGTPVADAFVVAALESKAGVASLSSSLDTEIPHAMTRPDGTFAIGELVAGSYGLRAFQPAGAEATVSHVTTGSSSRIVLVATGSIAGTIGPDSARPLRVWLEPLSAGASREDRFAHTTGRYHLDDLPPGRYRITTTDGVSAAETIVDLAPGQHLTGVDLTLDASLSVTGRIVDQGSHQPVAGIQIEVGLRTERDAQRDTTTGTDGRFTLTGVPHGHLSLWAGARGYKSRFLDREAQTGGTLDLGDIPITTAAPP